MDRGRDAPARPRGLYLTLTRRTVQGLLQFTLDLFDDLPVLRRVPKVERPPRRPATPPELPPAQAPAPVPSLSFEHPHATREVLLGRARVAYEFVRSRRRTIGFVVDAQGLSVRAPRWASLREVDEALQEKAGWIVRKLDEAAQRQAQSDAARIHWRDGACFPFLGGTMRVRLDPSHRLSAADAAPEACAAEDGMRVLSLALACDAEAAQIRDAVQAWLMRQARRIFTERLDHFAPRLGVHWRRLTLSNARMRWGSANAHGAISLNWRLIHLDLPIIDYVVAHELAHLRVMDHSPRFWATVEAVVPDHALRRRQLKGAALPPWH